MNILREPPDGRPEKGGQSRNWRLAFLCHPISQYFTENSYKSSEGHINTSLGRKVCGQEGIADLKGFAKQTTFLTSREDFDKFWAPGGRSCFGNSDSSCRSEQSLRAVAQSSRTWEVVCEGVVMAPVLMIFIIFGSSEYLACVRVTDWLWEYKI